MKRFFALFAALTLFCTGISAQTAACRTETGIAYRDAAGDGYVDSLCRLDICWPADRKGFPTVVWFHGGRLTGGRREIPKALCGKGFAVVGVDYRLAPRVKVADCVADAAALCQCSPNHFMRWFRQMTGQTFIIFLREYRLNAAAEALRTTEDTILSISEQCGFENLSYFNREFKAHFGMTPREYRK